jgi:2-hydroxychromene-2-carboxylate isomerase
MNLGPFLPYPSKMEYMWRDIERRARRVGVPYLRPSTYPVNSLFTARVACIAAAEGWCRPFTEKVFALHWTENRLMGTEDNLDSALRSLGQDPIAIKSRSQTLEGKGALKQQTEAAKSLKIFGAPSFVTAGELFWGDDRLEEAVEWAASH